jgi:glycerol-3-phosphate acyltransferase PlsY
MGSRLRVLGLENPIMPSAFWFIISFLSGSIPYSVWIGKLATRRDIRDYGDGNPGTTNVFRAGGKIWGVVALLLDCLKGAVPVGLAYWLYNVDGWPMTLIAVAPILGHAFSPFLGFRGGKALAVSLGIWTGLTLFQAPLLLGISLSLALLVIGSDAWPLFPALLTLLLYLVGWHAPAWMFGVWGGNLLIIIWKHRKELRQPPHLRPWLRKAFHLP